MYNLKAKPDVCEIANLLRNVGCMRVEQVRRLLSHKGKTEKSINEILTILVNQRFAFWDETKAYLLSHPTMKLEQSEFYFGCELAMWLYISLYDNIEIPLFHCAYPSVFGYVYSNSAPAPCKSKMCNVYYLPEGREGFYASLIASTEFKADEIVNAIVILDSLASVKAAKLPSNFNVLAYSVIDTTGKVEFFK